MVERERDQAIRLLRDRYVRGELSNDEFEEELAPLIAAAANRERLQLPSSSSLHGATGRTTATSDDLLAVEAQLSNRERIQWIGKPDPTRHFTRADLFLIPFSLLWGGFALVWEASAIAGRASVFFVLFGVPFVAIALYLTVGRFIYKASRKRRTVYVVTDQRILEMIRGSRGESIDATYIRSIPNVFTSVSSHGRGSVSFGLSSPGTAAFANSGLEFFGRNQPAGITFFDIADPRAVADAVTKLRDADRSSTQSALVAEI